MAFRQEGLLRDSIYSLEEVIPYVVFAKPRKAKLRYEPRGRPERLYNGKAVKMDSLRYQTFAKKGTICVFCGIEATFFALEKHIRTNNGSDRWHLNLYACDEKGNEILFTKDHIKPRARGGEHSLDNLQPSCYPCNNQKGCGNSPKDGAHRTDNALKSRNKKKRLRRVRSKIHRALAENKMLRKATYVAGTPNGGPGYLDLVARRKQLLARLQRFGKRSERKKQQLNNKKVLAAYIK